MHKSKMQTALVALAVALGSSAATGMPALAQTLVAQSEATDIGAAVLAYRNAETALADAQENGGDIDAATANLDAATAQLGELCAELGLDDIDACLATVATGTPDPAPAEPVPADTAPVPDTTPDADGETLTADPETPAEPAAPIADAPAPDASTTIDVPPEALVNAVAKYEAANATLTAAAAEDGATEEMMVQLAAARAEIDQSCSALGAPDTDTCLKEFGIALSPEPDVAPAASGPAEAQAEPVVESPAASQPEIASEDPQPAPAPVAETMEPTAQEEPAAPEAPVNPAGTPLPRELGAEIASYEQANRDLAASIAGTPEAAAAEQALDAASANVSALCADIGAADVQSCLAGFGVALSPRAVALSEPVAPPAEEPQVLAEEAPLLDSAKDGGQTETAEAPAEPQEQAAPPPQSDADAQADAAPADIPSIEAEQATGAETVSDTPVQTAAAAPEGAEVVEQAGPRIVIKFNNQLIVSNQADTRLDYGASQRYVEALPRDRTRETILRGDGTRLVTVYDRYGNVLRRSHFDTNGNETILAYVPETYDQQVEDWRDPGESLPPLQLSIAPQDYVLDANRANLGSLTSFLSAPPVERVQRIYSIDEVKRSARLRDMVRRLEIGNLTFAFGSASIPPDQIGALSIVANAMLELIDRNPGETFLIEGHTDAVGSDLNNLVLSDSRAYSVAIALTEVFGIPPENIATQGYGERYLKVKTEAPEEANRRVTIRRITALIAPAVAAN